MEACWTMSDYLASNGSPRWVWSATRWASSAPHHLIHYETGRELTGAPKEQLVGVGPAELRFQVIMTNSSPDWAIRTFSLCAAADGAEKRNTFSQLSVFRVAKCTHTLPNERMPCSFSVDPLRSGTGLQWGTGRGVAASASCSQETWLSGTSTRPVGQQPTGQKCISSANTNLEHTP
jgi:hypothetical protein